MAVEVDRVEDVRIGTRGCWRGAEKAICWRSTAPGL